MTLQEDLRAFIEKITFGRAIAGKVKTGIVKAKEMKGMKDLAARVAQKRRATGLMRYKKSTSPNY